jgi:hypothetical protein
MAIFSALATQETLTNTRQKKRVKLTFSVCTTRINNNRSLTNKQWHYSLGEYKAKGK